MKVPYCYELDPLTNTWNRTSSLKETKSCPASVVVPNVGLWVTGGETATTQIYTKDKVWIDGPVLPVPMSYGHCALQLDKDNTLLAGGGQVRF